MSYAEDVSETGAFETLPSIEASSIVYPTCRITPRNRNRADRSRRFPTAEAQGISHQTMSERIRRAGSD